MFRSTPQRYDAETASPFSGLLGRVTYECTTRKRLPALLGTLRQSCARDNEVPQASFGALSLGYKHAYKSDQITWFLPLTSISKRTCHTICISAAHFGRIVRLQLFWKKFRFAIITLITWDFMLLL